MVEGCLIKCMNQEYQRTQLFISHFMLEESLVKKVAIKYQEDIVGSQ